VPQAHILIKVKQKSCNIYTTLGTQNHTQVVRC